MDTRSLVLFALTGAVCLISQLDAFAGPRIDAVAIYRAQASALVYQTVSSALLKAPGRPSEVSVTITFQLDSEGHVSNLAIVARKSGQWAEDVARAAMSKIRFQPASNATREELGRRTNGLVDVSTTVGFNSGPSD
jgi:hypothetical protein